MNAAGWSQILVLLVLLTALTPLSILGSAIISRTVVRK
jgi:hypothetical protein